MACSTERIVISMKHWAIECVHTAMPATLSAILATTSTRDHTWYVDFYGEEVVEFVIKQHENGGRSDNDGNSSSSKQGDDADDRNAASDLVPVSTLVLLASL